MTDFRLIPGGGDVVSQLEEALEHARSGTLVGIVICGITEIDGKPCCGWSWAHRDDLYAPWARLSAILGLAHFELTKEGIDNGRD